MEAHQARIGMWVKVQQEYRKAHLRGLVGRIKQRYGGASYVAVEVWFPDRQIELFWPADLDKP